MNVYINSRPQQLNADIDLMPHPRVMATFAGGILSLRLTDLIAFLTGHILIYILGFLNMSQFHAHGMISFNSLSSGKLRVQ